jgi:DNA-binding transcriptional regulator YdaS (Cro superfamily)
MDNDDPTAEVRAALTEAIGKAGSQTALAEAIGEDVKTGHIYYWLKAGVVPERHCPVIEQATGVSRKRLCPSWQRVWPELAEV